MTIRDLVVLNEDASQLEVPQVGDIARISQPVSVVDISFPDGSSMHSAVSVNREVANGVAGLDANSEVIRLPAGANAEVLAGRPTAVKQADGTWVGGSGAGTVDLSTIMALG